VKTCRWRRYCTGIACQNSLVALSIIAIGLVLNVVWEGEFAKTIE